MKLDPDLDQAIQRALGWSADGGSKKGPSFWKSLAESVLKMSDFYRDHPAAPTPWDEKWCREAQIAYFLPLNFVRARAVAWEVSKRGFFQSLRLARDVGSGLGVMEWALRPWGLEFSAEEISPVAQKLAQSLGARHLPSESFRTGPSKARPDLITWSYSLTEEIPLKKIESSALLMIEPSLKADARRLQKMRESLVESGWNLAGPCTHAEKCPLLSDERDWCHDRIHFEAPDWFRQLEAHLPMKNETLTFSFLAATKLKLEKPKVGRLVGDFLIEKGKSRVLLCRSQQKETLTWLHRDLNPEPWSRGTLLEKIPEGAAKGPELRLKEDLKGTP